MEHDRRLVALALVICLLASLTAFKLADHIAPMQAPRRPKWILALAFLTGAGVWATHFIAMLAYHSHMPSAYSLGLTILSILFAIILAGLAWSVALSRSRWAPYGAGFVMMLGIGAMHFIGMSALRTTGYLVYDTNMLVVAAGLSWFAATAALWLRIGSQRRVPLVAALAFATSIGMLHFGAMSAATIVPDPSLPIPSGIDALALTIVVASLVLAMLVVAVATVILDGRMSASAAAEGGRLKSFADSSLEGLAILDGDRIVDANRAFWRMAGQDPNLPPVDMTITAFFDENTFRKGNRIAASDFNETVLRAADGRAVCVEVADRESEIAGRCHRILVVRDLTERKAAADRSALLSSHDPLTGVANRSTLASVMDEAIAEAESSGGSVAMLCIDLKEFKEVNGRYGYGTGDGVLVEVAQRMGTCLGEGDTLARLGGDKFAIVQTGDGQPARAGRAAAGLADCLRQPFTAQGHNVQIGARVGIAIFPDNASSSEDLHRSAEVALSLAKSKSGDSCQFFDEETDRQIQAQRSLSTDLQNALEREELRVYYQPFVCLATGGIIGFEALLRWQHPERGAISPAIFVPIAEENREILPIGEWVLREACREAQRWSNPLKISVNISPIQLMESDIVSIVADILRETGLDPSRLELEITESSLIKESEKTIDSLSRLRTMGVSISLDDFGTGYSSLGYFRLFVFDKVKIDQTFVRHMVGNRQSMAVIQSVIALSKGLDMIVIAEGVETLEQMEILSSIGCHQIQGYVISRPAPIANFHKIVEGAAAGAHGCSNNCSQCIERLRGEVGMWSKRGDDTRSLKRAS